MEEALYNIEYIDQYLSGHLDEKETLAFEKKMDSDPELAKAVKDVIRAKSASYLTGKEKWKAEMNQKFDDHLKPRRFTLWPLMVAAVAAVFLVLAGIWWSQNKTLASPQEVYAQVYQTPAAPEYRGEKEGLDSLLAIAYGSYNSGEYEQALAGFDQLSDRDDLPNREEVLFLKGIALLELNKDQDALGMLAQIQGEQYGESARYYEALILLKRGQTELAKKTLLDLVEFDGTWKGRAVEILEMLGE